MRAAPEGAALGFCPATEQRLSVYIGGAEAARRLSTRGRHQRSHRPGKRPKPNGALWRPAGVPNLKWRRLLVVEDRRHRLELVAHVGRQAGADRAAGVE